LWAISVGSSDRKALVPVYISGRPHCIDGWSLSKQRQRNNMPLAAVPASMTAPAVFCPATGDSRIRLARSWSLEQAAATTLRAKNNRGATSASEPQEDRTTACKDGQQLSAWVLRLLLRLRGSCLISSIPQRPFSNPLPSQDAHTHPRCPFSTTPVTLGSSANQGRMVAYMFGLPGQEQRTCSPRGNSPRCRPRDRCEVTAKPGQRHRAPATGTDLMALQAPHQWPVPVSLVRHTPQGAPRLTAPTASGLRPPDPTSRNPEWRP
jgi:hypothetical protein